MMYSIHATTMQIQTPPRRPTAGSAVYVVALPAYTLMFCCLPITMRTAYVYALGQTCTGIDSKPRDFDGEQVISVGQCTPDFLNAYGKLRIPAPIAQFPRLNTLAHAEALFSTPTAIPPILTRARLQE